MSDRASRALVEGNLPGEPRTYDAISKRSNVPVSTLQHRAKGRCSREDKSKSQLYLNPQEKKALENFLKLKSDLGNHVRIKFIPSLAFSIARQRTATDKSIKPPGKIWAKGFKKRYSVLKSRRVRAIDWNRHERNIYDKITH